MSNARNEDQVRREDEAERRADRRLDPREVAAHSVAEDSETVGQRAGSRPVGPRHHLDEAERRAEARVPVAGTGPFPTQVQAEAAARAARPVDNSDDHADPRDPRGLLDPHNQSKEAVDAQAALRRPSDRAPGGEGFLSQAEADEALAAGRRFPSSVRAARKPLDFVPGEHPKQRALRLKILHGIVE